MAVAEDLARLATYGGEGAIWTLKDSEELNVNLIRFEAGRAEVVGEHTNDEVEVLFVGLAGSAVVKVDGEPHPLKAGRMVLVPKGSRRSVTSASETESLAYLTVHRRRGPVAIGGKPQRS